MKEIQSINNYPICDAEARAELENKANKYHEHEDYVTKTYVNTLFNNFDMSDFVTEEELEDAMKDYVDDQIANAVPNIDLSNYALKSEIEEAKYVSYYDLYLKDENGDFVVDENGDHVLDNFITRTEVQEMIDEVVLDFVEIINELF